MELRRERAYAPSQQGDVLSAPARDGRLPVVSATRVLVIVDPEVPEAIAYALREGWQRSRSTVVIDLGVAAVILAAVVLVLLAGR